MRSSTLFIAMPTAYASRKPKSSKSSKSADSTPTRPVVDAEPAPPPTEDDWDSEKMKFTNDDEANKLVNPPYRTGWKL